MVTGHQDRASPQEGSLVTGRVQCLPGQTPENLDPKFPRSVHEPLPSLCPQHAGRG